MTLQERYMRDAVTMLERIADELERLNRKIDDMTFKDADRGNAVRVWNGGPRT